LSDESAWSGVSVPVHENPIESPSHPLTVESGAHVDDVNWTQQYRTKPPLAGVPSLQTSDESVWSGVSPLPHE
jgi:hypothetical protein